MVELREKGVVVMAVTTEIVAAVVGKMINDDDQTMIEEIMTAAIPQQMMIVDGARGNTNERKDTTEIEVAVEVVVIAEKGLGEERNHPLGVAVETMTGVGAKIEGDEMTEVAVLRNGQALIESDQSIIIRHITIHNLQCTGLFQTSESV